MIIEKESREQAQIRQDILTGRKQEPERKDIWIPTIPESYIQFKEEYYYLGKINPMTTTTSKKKQRAKNAGASKDFLHAFEGRQWLPVGAIYDPPYIARYIAKKYAFPNQDSEKSTHFQKKLISDEIY